MHVRIVGLINTEILLISGATYGKLFFAKYNQWSKL